MTAPRKRSRRAFLRALVAAPTHISSVIVRVKPAHCAAAAAAIANLPGCEVAWRAPDDSKLVVLMEVDSDSAMMQQIQRIGALDGVITTDLAYAYNEENEKAQEEVRHG